MAGEDGHPEPDPRLHLRVLTGTRSGETLTFPRTSITVGRSPDVDLRFDPELERSVSGRHALLFHEAAGWYVRDLGSTNGTLVNGSPISGDTRLGRGDELTFGVGGPSVRFGRIPPGEPPPGTAGGENPSTNERVRAAVQRNNRRVAAAVGILAGLALVGTAIARSVGEDRRAEWERERSAMRLQIDSLEWAGAQALLDLERELQGLQQALGRSESRVQELQAALRQAESRGAVAEARNLRNQLEEASSRLQEDQTAAALDFRALQAGNRPAVAMVYVEMPNGEVSTGTALAVRPNATLLTNRHVVAGAQGRSRPRRIAIQFSDSEQVWPARVLAVATDADLALVKVDNILGDVPFASRFNLRPDTLPVGAPVAMIGFPNGGEPPPEGARSPVARPLVSGGVLRRAEETRIEVRGYGATGASGSPIVDANGEIVAIVFGGRVDPNGHSLFAVPATAVLKLIETVP